MTLKHLVALSLCAIVLSSCGGRVSSSRQCLSSLETSTKAATVSTASGQVAGYIDDGVFIFKGIPYA